MARLGFVSGPLLGWKTRSCLPSGRGDVVVLMSSPPSRCRRNSPRTACQAPGHAGVLSVVPVHRDEHPTWPVSERHCGSYSRSRKRGWEGAEDQRSGGTPRGHTASVRGAALRLQNVGRAPHRRPQRKARGSFPQTTSKRQLDREQQAHSAPLRPWSSTWARGLRGESEQSLWRGRRLCAHRPALPPGSRAVGRAGTEPGQVSLHGRVPARVLSSPCLWLKGPTVEALPPHPKPPVTGAPSAAPLPRTQAFVLGVLGLF